ncbi:phage tail protein [Phreatobacter stygius]|uniref:Phage tail protein n=1 Tax=Phreatobacter stygius TaxID=1940610 RepID=A0A4D7B645_9HYPH|nr:phage tail protein [Phreatobacter stygius]QCI65630.1 phage tail protein [Phreatobacter stygius]
MAEYHHGPEVIERFEAGTVVRDVKAATLYLIGTAPVHVPHATPEARAGYINTDIIVRKKEDAVAAFGAFSAGAGYTIPSALHAIFNKDRGQGVGTIIVRNVFDPDVHKEAAAPDPTKVLPADIIGELTVAGVPKGLEAAMYTYGKFGYFARRLIAPGFSTTLGVRQKMLAVANKIKAHAIADLPPGLTKQGIVAKRGVAQDYQASDDRLVYCAPHVKALDAVTADQSLQPLSQHFAGVWNEVVNREEGDNDGGPAASPSNRAMPDVSGTEIPLAFFPGDYSSDTNFLNEVGIATANMGQFGSGIVTWGAHASTQGATGQGQVTRWLHVRAMYDVLHEAILFYLMPHVDRRGTPQRIEYIEDQIQQYLNRKERDGWLYGGRFRFDRSKNTAEEILGEGRFWYRIDGAPVGIQHRITVENYIDLSLVRSALGLGGATS